MINIKENHEIKNETTFKIGGCVKKAAFPETKEELVSLLNSKEYDMVLGNCSNVLFSSDKIDKNIIITKNMTKFSFDGNELTALCGVRGPYISKEGQKRGLSGFEFMIGFPGSLGGMLCMNASAHNQAISDTFVSAYVYEKSSGKIFEFDKSDMNFGYRKSILSEGEYVLLEAKFALVSGDTDKISEMTERNIKFRQERQPSLTYGNAGSIFKNPENDSAGRLLDLCEMKGETEGGAKVFENHANFILNYNNATSKDVINLMHKMHKRVKEKYLIELKPEIIYIGNDKTEETRLWREMKKENTQKMQK